jgi:para-aminobenzoate synthetase/4-amino-4-deoxychorismate lyase
VAIRTLTVDRELGKARYPIGSGITWYSSARDEYQECLDKARVLQYHRPVFSLLETMRAEGGEIPLLDMHLNRLQSSAQYFGISMDENKIREALHTSTAKSAEAEKLRLILSQTGGHTIERHPIPESKIWRVALAHTPVHSDNVFLYHKTTHRNFYEEKRKEHPECDDVILWNERGELTESTFANIVLEMDGVKYTPPVSCGLLGGVYRQKLLYDGEIIERIMYKADLQRANYVYLINSVRIWIEIVLDY